MKRILTLVLTAFILSGLAVSLLACGQDSDSTAVTEAQVVTVQRGDLTIDITAVGNLAFAYEEELIFGVGGTVSELLVVVGDSVEEGQVLAELDDTSIISLQKAVTQARIDLRNAELTVESEVVRAEATVANAKVALEAAQEALEEAENPYTESDIVQAELAVINAEIALDNAEQSFEMAEERHLSSPSFLPWAQDYEQKQKELAIAEFELAEAEETLVEMIAGADPLEVEQKQKQLAVAQANLKEAEDDLARMLSVELGQLEVASAQDALDKAIEQLEMATMAAPFAGIVISVNVEAGDTVNANQVVIELADPDKFEAEILVSEMDISNMQLGAEASIQVDAMPGIVLPAQVTRIAPTAIIQVGVVNYKVRVEIQSLQAMMQERQETRQKVMPELSSGELPDRIKQAIEEGLITQEQAEEMLEQMQEGKMPFQQGGEQLPTIISEDLQLREGLTVTISIIVAESNDVLLVPNSAIIGSGRQTYVKVVLPDGTIEDRLVMTGISNWQYTEIIDGLSEGEKVVLPETTGTTTTTPQPKGAIPFFPGMRK